MRLKAYKEGRSTWTGRAPIDADLGLDFDLVVTLATVRRRGMPDIDGVHLTLDLGSYEAEDIEAGVARLALWLRAVAKDLDKGVPLPRALATPSAEVE